MLIVNGKSFLCFFMFIMFLWNKPLTNCFICGQQGPSGIVDVK